MYTYTYTYTYMHVYIYIYMRTWLCAQKTISSISRTISGMMARFTSVSVTSAHARIE